MDHARLQECFALPRSAYREGTAYGQEPRGRWASNPPMVVAPARVEEVSRVVRVCADMRVPIIPYGGGSGLVGGQIAPELDAVTLSLERMHAIRNVFADENVLIAEAGAILADVQAMAHEVDRLFPLSLASEGTARIGGLLSTNAGGVNVLRYGNARDLCLGVEAVLPNGEIWHGLRRLRKDNLGYDLRNLLIGAEGTLGIITAAALKLAHKPGSMGTAMVVVPHPKAALELLNLACANVGEGVCAFELIHRQSMQFLAETMPQVRLPFSTPPLWCVLIEVGLSAGIDAQEALSHLFAHAYDKGLAMDGIIAKSERERKEMWRVRESIPEANRKIGSISNHDISLPLSTIPDFIEKAERTISGIGEFRINCFGHVGDGNLHYNVFPPPSKSKQEYDGKRPAIKSAVHDLVHLFGGSVAAEHGVGRLKVEDMKRYGDPAHREAMRAIKAALDPQNIMNPGVMFD